MGLLMLALSQLRSECAAERNQDGRSWLYPSKV